MRVLKTVIFAALLLILPVYSYASAPQGGAVNTLGNMRISLIEGDVQIRIHETGDWVPASVNVPLMEGDEIWVPEGGRTEIQLNNGTHIRLDQESAMQVLATNSRQFQFNLTQGYAYVYSVSSKGTFMQFDTPGASIRSYGSSIFRIDMPDQFATEISVYKGYVVAESMEGSTRVSANQTLFLGRNTGPEITSLGSPDEWERWNKTRNHRFFTRKTSYRYLPDELRAYSSDFDDNGSWVKAESYGYVWVPTVHVNVGWAPYRHGRWIWRGIDYVWVGYEPWGWAPYHYGRWSFSSNIGWFWVPPSRGQVYWGPGYVGWVSSNDYVAWVPLAPGEVYYGYGNYGLNSVNISNTNYLGITNINYRNIYVATGVTVVTLNTFVNGTPSVVNITGNPFLTWARDSVRPDIRPVKASYVPVFKQIHPAKQPPQAVRDIFIKDLKKARPVVKDSERSVIRQGEQARELPVKNYSKKTPAIQQPTASDRVRIPSPNREIKIRQIEKTDGREGARRPSVEQGTTTKQPAPDNTPQGSINRERIKTPSAAPAAKPDQPEVSERKGKPQATEQKDRSRGD